MENLKVLDTSAIGECPERHHEIMVDGVVQRYTFKQGQYLVMPMVQAMKFSKAGFIVKDIDDNDVLSPAAHNPLIERHMSDGEVIAKYEELMDESLRIRVALKLSGEKYINSDRDVMIDFLKFGEGKSAPIVDVNEAVSEVDHIEPVVPSPIQTTMTEQEEEDALIAMIKQGDVDSL